MLSFSPQGLGGVCTLIAVFGSGLFTHAISVFLTSDVNFNRQQVKDVVYEEIRKRAYYL